MAEMESKSFRIGEEHIAFLKRADRPMSFQLRLDLEALMAIVSLLQEDRPMMLREIAQAVEITRWKK